MMPLLNSIQNDLLADVSRPLAAALQDIVDKVQIEPQLKIFHPDFKPFELPSEVVDRFARLPADQQFKYRILQLQGFLYGIYYNGSMRMAFAPDTDLDGLELYQNLENNTLLGVDLEFFERLHENNCGNGYFSQGWQVVRQESDGALAVLKDGLTLHIDRDRHLPSSQQHPAIGELVAIRMPRNLLQNGFYLAVGNAGSEQHTTTNSQAQLVRVYCNLTPEGAVAAMAKLTQSLNDAEVPFSFKVLYNPSDYTRHDSGVLYFKKSDYETVHLILQEHYPALRSQFKPDIPLFTKMLAPGLALAEEPNRKFATQESFGQNRCRIVAEGLMAAWQRGDHSPEGRINSILEQFSLLEINLRRPYLNANSDDSYFPLNYADH